MIMENKEHVLLCIMGKSACGKDSLVNKLSERTGLKKLISYTTRPPRVDEGDTHIFVSEADYERMQEEGQIAAFTQIGEYKYWATVDQIYEADLYIVDHIGLKKLRELNLPNFRLVSVFINTPDSEREYRALNIRKDDKVRFRIRCRAENEQFREMLRDADFDYAVSNINLATCYSVVRWIATVEGVFKNHEEDTTK